MWKRWNNQNGNRGPYIGHPTLIETTVEEGYLETIPEVDSLKSQRSSGSTALPELPFRAMPPMQSTSPDYIESTWSQPPHVMPDYYASQYRSPQTNQHPDISPPSSPPMSTHDYSTPISPIDSESGFSSAHPSFSRRERPSRIPQRVVSDRSKKDETSSEEKQETRWDAYSGEPTKDNSGQLSTVRPGVQPLEHQYPQLKERTKQILAGLREREATTNTGGGRQPPPVASTDTLDFIVHKEPWRGASGRTTLVDPVQNTPSARVGPLNYPQRNISRVKPEEVIERSESPTYTLRSVASEESIKPIAPLKILTKSRNPSPQSSNGSFSTPPIQPVETIHSAPPMYQHPKTLQSPFSSPGPIRDMDFPAPLVSARAESPPNDPAPDTPRTPTSPVTFQTSTPLKVQQMPTEHDVSRFSWTTYATSVAESPGNMAHIIRHESPPPPVPQMPPLHIRKRPVSASYNTAASPKSIISRKPVGGKPRTSIGAASQLSLSKTLPQIPPEMEATDKITNLETQLQALAIRKHNTTRILRDLNESLKKNAIVYDLWKRREIGDRIANQELELQCITNEEHEIGIALHRSQKKRDMESNYEIPTGLWIRRVTS